MITLEELEKLAKLKDKGIITEEEFSAKKEEFLKQSNDNNTDTDEASSSSSGIIGMIFFIIATMLIWDINPLHWFNNIFNSNNPCVSQIRASAPNGYKNNYLKKICSNGEKEAYALKGDIKNALGQWLPAAFLCAVDTKSNAAFVLPQDMYSPAFINADESLCE